jgi:two-component system OmpR family response regulator|tara:strand:+ start:1019 stop:1702 length:684 start_codon:yes stop_codon:yes gene_type:complete
MKILLLEDDRSLGPWLKKNLNEMGNSVDLFIDGNKALIAGLKINYEIMIIDRMVPGLDGLTVIKKIRDQGIDTPTIFLTALNDIENRVQGFDAGGDDYLSKPFALEELISRINALHKRSFFKRNQSSNDNLKSGDLEIDLTNRLCFRQKRKIELNNKELMLLEYFIRFEGQKLTKSMLLELVWNIDYDPTTSIVETHISRLRSKIEKPFKDRLIKTIRSSGYVYQSK